MDRLKRLYDKYKKMLLNTSNMNYASIGSNIGGMPSGFEY